MLTLEPAFRRLRAEHRVLRAVLVAAEAGAARSRGRRLARHLDALGEHAAYEEDVLFPYLLARVPDIAVAVEHAGGEHEYFAWHLPRLLGALRAGREYEGPMIAALRHHFEEEERDILAPALDAGVAATPLGEPGHLLAVYESLTGIGRARAAG